VPVHVGPEGDATYHGPAPSDGVPLVDPAHASTGVHPVPSGVPVHVGPEGDATYHGPVPSDGVPVHIGARETTRQQVTGPNEQTTRVDQTTQKIVTEPHEPTRRIQHGTTPGSGVPVPVSGPEETTQKVVTGANENETTQKIVKPDHGPHPTEELLRKAIRARMKDLLEEASGDKANPQWQAIEPLIDSMPSSPENDFIKQFVRQVHEVTRSKQALEDGMVEIWELARKEGISTADEIVKIAGGGRELGEPIEKELRPAEFGARLQEDQPVLDLAFKGVAHGAYTHLFQQIVAAKVIGRENMTKFRQVLSKVTHPAGDMTLSDGTVKPFWARVWDGLFDEIRGEHTNTPEELGPVLHDELGVEPRPPKKP
jgi:hypothetical protein